jgi:hypothetical protein
MSIGRELLNVPMGDMIRQMAFAIADAQFQLDDSSMRVAEMMSGARALRDAEGHFVNADGTPATEPVFVDTRVYFGSEYNDKTKKYEPSKLSMMELGFTPTFYQFIDTLIEVKIAIKITSETSRERKVKGDVKTISTSLRRDGLFSLSYGCSVTTTPVDATYSAKYSYSAEGSSLLRTKLVPVPPPAILEDRIRALIDNSKAMTTTGQATEGTTP